MKTKKLTTTVIALLVVFNLTASVIIITNGCKTLKPNYKVQNFIPSLIY